MSRIDRPIEDQQLNRLRMEVYRWIAETTKTPTLAQLTNSLQAELDDIRLGLQQLHANRVLVLEPDGETIRMAMPFSAVPTQHRVSVGQREYFAPCAWDALGIAAALQQPAEVSSRCDQTLQLLRIDVTPEGPKPVQCVIHFAVPAVKWWDDIVYT